MATGLMFDPLQATCTLLRLGAPAVAAWSRVTPGLLAGQIAAPRAALKAVVFSRGPAGIGAKVTPVEKPCEATPFFWAVSWKERKKKSLSFLIGPPNTPPNWFWSSPYRLFCGPPLSTWVFLLRKICL